MKTQNTPNTTAHELDMDEFAQTMLAAEASGAVGKIEVPAPKPAKKIAVYGNFWAKTPEGKNAFWKPYEGPEGRPLRDDYMAYMVSAYNRQLREVLVAGEAWVDEYENMLEEASSVDEVSKRLGLERNELRIDCPIWDGYYYSDPKKEEETFAYAARVFGFLWAVQSQNFTALHEVIKHLRGKGYNSPAYKMSVLALAQRSHCWNPGKLNRAIYAAQEAAKRKHGVKIGLWVAARAVAVAGVKNPGRAATVAFAISLGWNEQERRYSDARDFVIKVLLAKRAMANGKETPVKNIRLVGGRLRKGTQFRQVNGWAWAEISVYKSARELEWCEKKWKWDIPLKEEIPFSVTTGEEKIILLFPELVIYQPEKVGGQYVVDVAKTLANIAKYNKAKEVELEGVSLKVLREFQASGYKFLVGWTQKIDNAKPRVLSVEELITGEIYQVSRGQAHTTKRALESAVSAFHKRAAARLQEQQVVEVVDPDKGVLVTLQDSYAVGNCVPGTAAWMRQNGFEGKILVPLWRVHEAAEKSNNNLARNVVKAVVAEYLQQVAA